MTQTTGSIDFAPAATALAQVVAGITDEQLAGPTPCPEYTVGDLVDHVAGLAVVFTDAARKQTPDAGPAPSGDASRLPEGWRTRIADDLAALAVAWREPAAYEGLTMAGPAELPGPVAAQVALDEIVVHGWDLARATGQPFTARPEDVAVCTAFAESFEVPDDGGPGGGLFGRPVAVPAAAPALDRLIGLTGRHPDWAPRAT